MGEKSRPEGWVVEICFKRCANRDIECDNCVCNRKFKPIKELT